MSEPDDQPEEVGSVADETAKLLGALGGWVRDHRDDLGPDLGAGIAGAADRVAGLAAGLESETAAGATHLDPGAPECRWCPVCRTVHALRQLDPELRDQLTVAATSLLQAGAGLVSALAAGVRDQPARTNDVERIDLDPDPDPSTDTDGSED